MNASVLLNGRNQFRGEPKAPFTLVEFGDYECPPCRATQNLIPAFMAKYGGRVRMDFRQFPLTQLHPHARAAAMAAESGYLSNRLWQIHDRLFVADLAKRDAVKTCLGNLHIGANEALARKQLGADIKLANKMGVTGTPSFVLCCPDGKVFWIPSLAEIDPFIVQYAAASGRTITDTVAQLAKRDLPICGGAGGQNGCVP